MKIFNCVLISAIAASSFGCGQSNVNVAINNANHSNALANLNKPADTPAPTTEISSPGSLATPSDAYRTAYAVREKKDVAGMKRIMSKDVIEFLTMIGEGEKKTLDDEIKQMFDRPQAKTSETRNEKIKGDRATIEYLAEEGKWKSMDFVKEGGEWKLGLPAKDDVDPGATSNEKAR